MMLSSSNQHPSVIVIGGGPAGLMAADILIQADVGVDLYDSMPSVGRKFLVAGKGGLNITHLETRDQFLSNYGLRRPQLESILDQFNPASVRQWVHSLGIDTFIGTSNRVFPVGMKAEPILQAWLKRLRKAGVNFHMHHKWCGWSKAGSLVFETPDGEIKVEADGIVLALGGGSWKRLGSTGEWVTLLTGRGLAVAKLKPSNCGFDVSWSEHFRSRYEGTALKSVAISFTDSKGGAYCKEGEFIVTVNGVEGSLVYALSAKIRDEIETAGKAVIKLDMAPGWTKQRLFEKLSRPRGSQSMSNHIRKSVGLQGVKVGLLREFVLRENFNNIDYLAGAIKELPLPLIAPRPLDEAISSAGGVLFEELDEQLMIRSIPGTFCAGEMLDWEAPTGGYLITACLATGRAAGLGALAWVRSQRLS
jgi:uncharacterized flavoprotein (TIGR03862 family)